MLGVTYGVNSPLTSSYVNHFTELNSSAAWVEQGYYKNFKSFTVFSDSVERISIDNTSPQEFIEQYEKPYKPVRAVKILLYFLFRFQRFIVLFTGCDS